MIHLKKYFILFTCLCMVPGLNGSYAFVELEEMFKNDCRMAISLLFKNSADVILYGIDTNQNRILIKPTDNFFITKNVEINFNGIILHKNVIEDHLYSIFELKLFIEFKDGNLIFENKIYHNIFIGDRLNLGVFEGLPIPANLPSLTNRMFLWFGNTGPYKGSKDYSPFPIQMIGCIEYSFINLVLIHMTKIIGKDVSPSCVKQFQETVCKQNKCYNKIVEEHYFNCSGYSTQRFCYKDLVPFSENLVSYQRIPQVHQPISIKLAWEEETFKRVCLIEVVFENKVNWLFYINELHEIVLTKNADQLQSSTDKILGKVPQKQINVIVINFRLQDLHVVISTGNAINTTIEKSPGYPQQINIGISSYSNGCMKFEGKTAFRYVSSQLKPNLVQMPNKPKISSGNAINTTSEINPGDPQQINIGIFSESNGCVKCEGKTDFRYDSSQFKSKPKDPILPFWITLLVAISIGPLLLVFVIVGFFKTLRTKPKDEKEIVNLYEMEKSPLPPIPNEKELSYDIYEEVK